MKLTFLGTSAGESYPAIWCECANCTYAREHGGRNIRMNTGTMIDSDILMDMNSCGFYTAARLGISLAKAKHLLVTHPHTDHNTMEPLKWRRATPGSVEAGESAQKSLVSPRFTDIPVMTVYGGPAAKERILREAPELLSGSMKLAFCDLHDGQAVDAGDGLTFIPVAALHGGTGFPEDTPPEEREKYTFTHNYILRRGGKTLLYALDTGGYGEESLALILAQKYDCVVMEGTFGLSPEKNDGHMNHDKNVDFRNLLLEKGCITADTPFILTHLCPHWTPPYDIYAPMMEKEGFIVAYDGMQFEF